MGTRALSEQSNFVDLYSELSSSLLLWEESTGKKGCDPETEDDLIVKPQSIPMINFGKKNIVLFH